MNAGSSLIDDCFLHDRDRLRHDDAIGLLRNRLASITDHETIQTADALGRILAEQITASHDVPLHTNAAVDGYAFQHADLVDSPIPVAARIAAGDLAPPPLARGSAARIFTGAVMPPGADTVAMQEDCATEGDHVTIPAGLRQGANCRRAGEDLQAGDTLLTIGTRLQAADLAALASIGQAKITVSKPLRVALFASGNELRQPDTEASRFQPGEVYDANTPMLSALLARLPVSVHPGGVIPDTRKATHHAIKEAAARHDVIVATGGASRGAEDHMLSVLDELGHRHLWQLAVKPGRPMMFGQFPRPNGRNCLFFGLPGNPVAAMVCFVLYTRPALLALAGARWEEPTRYMVPALFDIKDKKPDRREFLRGILDKTDDGLTGVTKFARDGSGLISSLREADGLIEIEEETTTVSRGDLVRFIPFSSFD